MAEQQETKHEWVGEVVGGVDVEGEQRVAPHDELDAEREREVLVPVERARSVGERERQVDRDRSDVRAIASQVGDEGDRAGTDEIDEGACAHEVTVRDDDVRGTERAEVLDAAAHGAVESGAG